MALVAKRKLGATWREAVTMRVRDMRPAALEECLRRYDEILHGGGSDAEAAFRALRSADLLWAVEAPGLTPAVSTGPHDVPSV